MKTLSKKWRDLWLTWGQFLLIAFHLVWYGRFSYQGIHCLVFGLILIPGFWALYVLRSQFSIYPAPRRNEIVRKGPYRWIRHPMYTVLFALSLMAFFIHPGWVGLMLTIVLSLLLFKKIAVEEEYLSFLPQYKKYKSETKKLFPFFY